MHPRVVGLLLYQAVFWVLLLLPFDFHLPRSIASELGPEVFYLEHAPGMLGIELLKSITHAILLLPLAPLVAWCRAEPLRRIFNWKVLALVGLLSAGSEVLQLTVSRGTSVPDFLMDLLGFMLGLLGVRCHRRLAPVRSAVRFVTAPLFTLSGIAAVVAGIYVLVTPREGLPFRPQGLEAWDTQLPLCVGSERTRYRPWAGIIERISVRAGEPHGDEVLAYDFTPADIMLDASGRVATARARRGPRLDAYPGLGPWPVPAGGIEARPPSLLVTQEPPSEAVERIQEAGSFSVEVRFATGDLGQRGPARIVTSSKTNQVRNFTLSQDLDGLEFRVRTPITGLDASLGGTLRVANCLKTGEMMNVKASYRKGVLELRVNGKLRGERQICYLDWLSHHAFGSPFNRRVEAGLAFTAWAVCAAFFWILFGRRRLPHRRAVPLAAACSLLTLLLAVAVAFPRTVLAADWPSWRGPGGVGVSPEMSIATKWRPATKESPAENVLWSIDDPGFGHSSPIVWKKALFFTTAREDSRLLLRLDADTGREVWRREVVSSPLERKHQKNSHASATPATDGERVYTSFLDRERVVAAAFDLDGKELWRTSPGEFHSMHGFCSTPLLFEDLVVLNCDQDAYAYLVALDRRTGAVRWKTDRENKVRSYCTPTVFEVEGKPQMILSGSKTVASYDPRDGRRFWVCDGPTEQCVASLVQGDGLIFVTGGFPDREFLAIDPTGSGDVTKTHIRWRANKGVSYVPSPLYHEGYFYVVSDTGVVSSLESRTGAYKTSKRLRGNFSASLLYASGHIYAFSEDGEVFVLKAAPDLETVEEISMGDPIYATPAVANGRMYLRTWKKLYAIGK